LNFYRIDIMTHTEMVAALKSRFGASVLGTVEFRGEQTVNVTLASIHEVMAFAKGELGFDYLVDISSLDHLGEEPRFEMVYELYGYGHGRHLRIKCKVSEDESVPTVSDRHHDAAVASCCGHGCIGISAHDSDGSHQ
jgi:NADH-quinone oxidoreductase subunit C